MYLLFFFLAFLVLILGDLIILQMLRSLQFFQFRRLHNRGICCIPKRPNLPTFRSWDTHAIDLIIDGKEYLFGSLEHRRWDLFVWLETNGDKLYISADLVHFSFDPFLTFCHLCLVLQLLKLSSVSLLLSLHHHQLVLKVFDIIL